MSYKKQTIGYIENVLIPDYLSLKHELNKETCGLCLLYCRPKIKENIISFMCYGCPCNNNKSVSVIAPCASMSTYPTSINLSLERKKAQFFIRAFFWQTALPKLKKIPAQAFNPDTFQAGDFDIMQEIDRVVQEIDQIVSNLFKDVKPDYKSLKQKLSWHEKANISS